MLTGDFDQVIAVLKKTVQLHPESNSAHRFLAYAYAEKGLFDEALDELKQETLPSSQTASYLASAGYVHALAGNSAEALKYVERLESSQEFSAYQKNRRPAQIYVGLGDYEEAFRRLADDSGRFLDAYHFWAPLRDDPRYHEMLRRVGLEP